MTCLIANIHFRILFALHCEYTAVVQYTSSHVTLNNKQAEEESLCHDVVEFPRRDLTSTCCKHTIKESAVQNR